MVIVLWYNESERGEVMSQQAIENQEFVRTLLFRKEPELSLVIACVVVEFDPVIGFGVIGFGDCETDVPPRFGGDELP